MDAGWLKLYRSIRFWGWYSDPKVKAIFLDLLIDANTKNRIFKGSKVGRGESVTSLESLARRNGLSIQEVRTALKKLKRTGEISVCATNQYSLITVNNFEQYQGDDEGEQTQCAPVESEQKTETTEQPKSVQPPAIPIEWDKDVNVENFASFLKGESRTWREGAMMALRIGNDDKALDSLIDDFQANCIASGVKANKEKDVRSHFVNYARKALQAKRIESEKPKSKRSATDKFDKDISKKHFSDSW